MMQYDTHVNTAVSNMSENHQRYFLLEHKKAVSKWREVMGGLDWMGQPIEHTLSHPPFPKTAVLEN